MNKLEFSEATKQTIRDVVAEAIKEIDLLLSIVKYDSMSVHIHFDRTATPKFSTKISAVQMEMGELLLDKDGLPFVKK